MPPANPPPPSKKPLGEIFFSTLLFLTIALSFAYFASYGSWNLFEKDPQGYNSAYDAMAESLKKGKTNIPKDILELDSCLTETGYQMYFGPWPSFFRLPLNELFPNLKERWGRASTFTSALLAAIALYLLIRHALEKNPHLSQNEKLYWLILTTAGLTLGSPLLFAAAGPSIYHEAILWGLAGCLWAMHFLLKTPETPKSQLLTSIGTSIALLSRIPSAFPTLVAQGFHLLTQKSPLKQRARIALPLALAFAITGWVNTERFGNPFTIIDLEKNPDFADIHYIDNSDPTTKIILPEIDHPAITEGNFHIQRIPDNLTAYFIPDRSHFSPEPPYIVLAMRYPKNAKHFGMMEPTLPIPLASTFLFILALMGIPYAWPLITKKFQERQTDDTCLTSLPWVYRGLLLGFFLQWLAILGIWNNTQRFTADLIPALLLFGLLTLQASPLLKSAPAKVFALILIVANILTTVFSTFAWTGTDYTKKCLPHQPLYLRGDLAAEINWTWLGTPKKRKEEVLDTLHQWKLREKSESPTNPQKN